MDTKRLDLFLLAGCSCLLTLLCQPIAQAIAAPPEAAHSALEASVQIHGAYCPADFSKAKISKRPSINH